VNSPPGSCIPIDLENWEPNTPPPPPTKTEFPIVPVAVGVVALGALGAFLLFGN
jgi:hypothetical protein